jgi:16S rRNA (guanine966-N2)-methyltransferase
VRIIAGSLGGRQLRAPRGQKTRPTSDKVRAAIFNILGNSLREEISGAVLDLYAGSGALGLEALSRGADRVVFVDQAPDAIRAIAANVAALGQEARAEIIRGEVAKVLPRLPRGAFALAFLDPPYRSAEAGRALAVLAPVLAPGAVVVVEHDRRSPPEAQIGAPDSLALHDRRRYGDTEVSFYR